MHEPLGTAAFLLPCFEGNRLNGAIAPALAGLASDGLVSNGLVRLLDVAVAMKDAAGETLILEMGSCPRILPKQPARLQATTAA